MMKLSYLKTHWTPEEAHTILTFLDDVRDVLWRTYRDEIVEYYQQQYSPDQWQDEKAMIDWKDDNIPF